jgi:hypothetical protein
MSQLAWNNLPSRARHTSQTTYEELQKGLSKPERPDSSTLSDVNTIEMLGLTHYDVIDHLGHPGSGLGHRMSITSSA